MTGHCHAFALFAFKYACVILLRYLRQYTCVYSERFHYTMVLVFTRATSTNFPHDRKMLKHGRAGVPMEVMGLMLGEFIDDYTAAGRRDLGFCWKSETVWVTKWMAVLCTNTCRMFHGVSST